TILKAMEKKSEDRYLDVKDFVTSLSTSIPGYLHASKLPRAGAILPSFPTSFDQPIRVTDISKDAAPQLAGTGKRTEENIFPQEEVSNFQSIEISSSHTQNANDEQEPLFLGSPLRVAPDAPTQTKLAPQVPPYINET